MKKIANGFFACLGLLSSVFAIEEKFTEYRSIFLVLIGVCVGFYLGQCTGADQPKEIPKTTVTSAAILLLIPPAALVALLIVIYFMGHMTNGILFGVLIGGSILLLPFEFLVYDLASKAIASSSNDMKNGEESNKEHASKNAPN